MPEFNGKARIQSKCRRKGIEYKHALKQFVIALTEELLRKGFSVSACPHVRSVGSHAIKTAIRYLAAKNDGGDYRLSGIYPVDKLARELEISDDNAREQWTSHIFSFRKSYLEDQEWLLFIGGNQGTYEEYKAAKEEKVKVFAIPCFGGCAKDLWEREATDPGDPCRKCNHEDGSNAHKCVERVVAFLSKKNIYAP